MTNKPKKKRKRQLEQTIADMSDTLVAMKDFMLKMSEGKADQVPKAKQGGGDRGNLTVDNSNSDTTIYQNALKRASEVDQIEVDPEISFKKTTIPGEGNKVDNNTHRDSTSSEEHN